MIFPWLFRVLPGGKVLKIIQLVIILAAVVFALFEVVFPWLDTWFGQDPAVGNTP